MSQTLFLKSNLLHIRLKEGEYEVENPNVEVRGRIGQNVTAEHLVELIGRVEWLGGVELIEMLQIRIGNDWKNLPYQNDYKGNMESTRTIKLARLLPEEKKSESAYKEGESSEPQEKRMVCDRCNQPIKWKIKLTDEDGTVSAPSESQEELLAEILGNWQDFISDPDNNSDFSSAKQQFMKAELEKFTIIETDKELSYNKIRSEYLKHRGRIWTKEEDMLKWIIENCKLITRNPLKQWRN